MKPDRYLWTSGLQNMGSRVGLFSTPEFQPSSIQGVTHMYQRLNVAGGRAQQDRMIRDKRRSLDKAVLYSYQGAFVKKIYQEGENVPDEIRRQPPVRALINPDKVKQDYDDKIISIGYEHGYQPGDVFRWENTGSYWLIYLQDKTELAYFRGEIRRCRYQIYYQDENGDEHMTYAAVRGPVETKIDYIQKNGISVDRPNYSLNFLLPASELNLAYFNRYSKFYLFEDVKKICWRVEAVDWLSMPGIIQINAVEYYVNEFEDDLEKGIAGGLIVKEEDPNPEEVDALIEGDVFIKPKGIFTYHYTGADSGTWFIDKKYPVEYRLVDDTTIQIRWTAGYSGQFEISYGDTTKTIVVESLF